MQGQIKAVEPLRRSLPNALPTFEPLRCVGLEERAFLRRQDIQIPSREPQADLFRHFVRGLAVSEFLGAALPRVVDEDPPVAAIELDLDAHRRRHLITLATFRSLSRQRDRWLSLGSITSDTRWARQRPSGARRAARRRSLPTRGGPAPRPLHRRWCAKSGTRGRTSSRSRHGAITGSGCASSVASRSAIGVERQRLSPAGTPKSFPASEATAPRAPPYVRANPARRYHPDHRGTHPRPDEAPFTTTHARRTREGIPSKRDMSDSHSRVPILSLESYALIATSRWITSLGGRTSPPLRLGRTSRRPEMDALHGWSPSARQ